MPIKFRFTLRQRIRNAIDTRYRAALDAIYSPVISRLTADEYHSCRTRNDCLRTYLVRFVPSHVR